MRGYKFYTQIDGEIAAANLNNSLELPKQVYSLEWQDQRNPEFWYIIHKDGFETILGEPEWLVPNTGSL